MTNKNYNLTISNNKKYIMGICRKNKMNDMYEMKAWNASTMKEINSFFVDFDEGGSRFAISDNGIYVATAKYDDFQCGGIYVYELNSGKVVFFNQGLKRIDRVIFSDNTTLKVGTDKYIYTYDVLSSDFLKKERGINDIPSKYRDNIRFLSEDTIKYNKIIYKSSTFAYLCVVDSDEGIVMSEVNGNIYYYDNNGNLNWSSFCLDLGHFISLYFDEQEKTIYGISLNAWKKGNDRLKLVAFDSKDGKVIYIKSIELGDYVFIENTGEKNLLMVKEKYMFLIRKE